MLILYGSKYGTAKRYAEEFAKIAGGEAAESRGRLVPAAGETVILFGAVYAGAVRGLRAAARAAERSGGAFAVATVGLTDPRDEGVRLALGKAVRASLPALLRERVRLFHLRGGIDYGRLTFAHGLLMKMMYAAQKKVPEEKKSAQERVIAQTYGSSADYTDFSALPAIAEEIEKV